MRVVVNHRADAIHILEALPSENTKKMKRKKKKKKDRMSFVFVFVSFGFYSASFRFFILTSCRKKLSYSSLNEAKSVVAILRRNQSIPLKN